MNLERVTHGMVGARRKKKQTCVCAAAKSRQRTWQVSLPLIIWQLQHPRLSSQAAPGGDWPSTTPAAVDTCPEATCMVRLDPLLLA